MEAVRLGFIGVGYIVNTTHLPTLAALAKSGQVVLSAFCDLNEKTLSTRAADYGVGATYTDYGEMLRNEELDAVYVCLPPTLHTDEVPSIAARGLAGFVEKPPSLDMQQATEHGSAVADAGIISQVGFQSRYYPSAEFTRRLLKERTPRNAHVMRFYSGAHIRYWTSRLELCGGSFAENTIHMVDLLRYFLGDIERVSAFYLFREPGEGPSPINNPHAYTVNMRFTSGVIANATTSRVLTNVDGSRMDLTVVSDDSLLDWSADRVVENGEVVWEVPSGESTSPQELQACAFVDAVRAGDLGATRSPYGDSLNSLAAVLAANISAERNGEPVDLQDVVDGTVQWDGLQMGPWKEE